jgi:uncharacterized lipoprotein YmbA
MKKYRLFSIFLLISVLLAACGRSKAITFYVLNPIPPSMVHKNPNPNLRIGINTIQTPDYIQKNEIMIHCTPQKLKLEEDYQWAEDLNKNISRVIMANLNTMIPEAVFENSPWNSDFKPKYTLQINITEFEIDISGNSILRAAYLIYRNDEIVLKRQVFYKTNVPMINMDSLVNSMNINIKKLTDDMAKSFRTKIK